MAAAPPRPSASLKPDFTFTTRTRHRARTGRGQAARIAHKEESAAMRLAFKFVVVVFLMLALLIPLLLIRGVITDREVNRRVATEMVTDSYADKQVLVGPVLVVPYVEQVEVEEAGPQGVRKVLQEREGQWTFFPDALTIDGRMVPDVRERGLYRIPVYELALQSRATVRARIPADGARPRRIGQPWLSVGVSDVRGFAGTPRMSIDGRAVPLVAGFGSRDVGGVHARLDAPKAGDVLMFDVRFDASIGGTESLALVPIAKDNRFTVSSPWPDPSFGGSFLPRTRKVGPQGFTATWAISSLATNAQAQYRAQANDAKASIDIVGITLFESVGDISLADRATKYGILFVLLTFVGFFMFELIKQLPIHPIQYGLVGLALAIFFLLLVSLSEHIRFGLAYLIASAACIGLLGIYLSAVLRSTMRGVGFAVMLATLYGALYGLLVSEDNALVLGSGLLFVVLATIMIVTRKVDWYALHQQRLGAPAPTQDTAFRTA
jgi:inner membrane protein